MFGKKRSRLFSQVDDSSTIVNDFRRRNKDLFEGYRAVDYRSFRGYDLTKLKEEDVEVLNRLVATNALDEGNSDFLINRVLDPVRKGFKDLNDQRLFHKDFYRRQSGNMKAHAKDLSKMIDNYRLIESQLLQKHEETLKMYQKYNQKKNKEGN